MKKILLLLLTISLYLKANDNIKIMTEIFPPFQYKHKEVLIGISTDIINAMQAEMNVKNKIEVYPWSEAINIVNHTKNTAIYSMLRTPERENKYKWVGPLSSMKLVFFKKKAHLLYSTVSMMLKKLKKLVLLKV